MRNIQTKDLEGLWVAYQNDHSTEIRDKLVHHYLPLVKVVAGRIAMGMPQYVEREELISNGYFGLLEAMERFDPKRGFKFETYAVDGNNFQVQKAIENNGNVKVNFYKESINWEGITWSWDSHIDSSSSGYPIKYYNFLTNNNSVSNDISSSCILTTSTSNGISSNVGSFNTSASTINKNEKSIETGVVGKGSKSEQKLVNDYSNFMYSPSWTSEWKILPEFRREITSDDLLVYCSCGRKQKRNEKFCPLCGKKFSLNEINIEIEKGDTVIIKNKNAISVVSDISLDGDGNKIYFVKYPMDDRWYKRNQIEFNHKN